MKEYNRSDNTGFTLVEVLIVTAIICILMVIAFYFINGKIKETRKIVNDANIRAGESLFMHSIVDVPQECIRKNIYNVDTVSGLYDVENGHFQLSDKNHRVTMSNKEFLDGERILYVYFEASLCRNGSIIVGHFPYYDNNGELKTSGWAEYFGIL